MKILKELKTIIPSIADNFFKSEKSIFLIQNQLIFTLNFLKNYINYQFSLLSCISGIDFLYSKYRFSVVYELLSLTFNSRLRVKIFVNEITSVNSITPVFQNVGWWEREIWDLFSINFKNHKNLRVILMSSGFIELNSDQNKKPIIVDQLNWVKVKKFRLFSCKTILKISYNKHYGL